MIKLIAFELDGTIADTIPFCILSFKKAVSPYCNQELTQDEITGTFGLNEEGMIKALVDKEWKKALADFYVLYRQMHNLCPGPFDGIKELISELKARDVLVALITGKGEGSCRITLHQFGMQGTFDSIQTGTPDKNRKSAQLIHLLEAYHLHPDELLYIGDTVSDINSCRQAGVTCLSAGWATSTDIPQLQANNREYTFGTVQELQKYLLRKVRMDLNSNNPR